MIIFCKDIVRVLRMRCADHTALISRAMDAPLSSGERVGLRLHKVYCKGCRRFDENLRAIRRMASTIGRDAESGADLPPDVRERLARAASQAKR